MVDGLVEVRSVVVYVFYHHLVGGLWGRGGGWWVVG